MNKMDLEMIQEIARVSKGLSELRGELNRYYSEEYLNGTNGKRPWITVRFGQHPTYLKDFTVSMQDDKLRDGIVKLAIQQIKMSIEKLEKELKELLK